MSRINEKMRLQQDLYRFFLMTTSTAQSSNECDEVLNYLILHEDIKQQRYLSRSIIFKSNWATIVFSSLSDTRLRDYIRMNQSFLNYLVDLISHDSIFHNKFSSTQNFIENQLKYALFRLKHDDSASEFLSTAIFWEISKRHVFDCIKRVVETLCRLKNKFVKWSDAKTRTRESLINDTREKRFIDVVEKIDDTNIVLHTKSDDKYDEKLFFNRKKRYALNLCAVCDSNKKFIYFLTDWSNSQHDQRIFVVDDLHKNFTNFFFEDKTRCDVFEYLIDIRYLQEQYLLDDNVYINIIYLIASYKVFHTNNSNIRRFNRRLFRIRIDIEHAFEILKSRWRSLTELRLRIRNKKNYTYVIRWIIACVILHNILSNIQDEWDENEEWWISEKENAHDEKLRQLIIKQLNERIAKREHVKEMILSND
jgi:predicted DNA-binding protein YlxM (UPF0122 family)